MVDSSNLGFVSALSSKMSRFTVCCLVIRTLGPAPQRERLRTTPIGEDLLRADSFRCSASLARASWSVLAPLCLLLGPSLGHILVLAFSWSGPQLPCIQTEEEVSERFRVSFLPQDLCICCLQAEPPVAPVESGLLPAKPPSQPVLYLSSLDPGLGGF